jgi:hypothetical protein
MVLKLVHLLWGIRVFAGRKGGVDERVVGDGTATTARSGFYNPQL